MAHNIGGCLASSMDNIRLNNHQEQGIGGGICDTEFSTSNHTTEVAMPVQPVAVLTNGRISGYYISAETWGSLAEYLEDMELGELVRSRQTSKRITVSLDDL